MGWQEVAAEMQASLDRIENQTGAKPWSNDPVHRPNKAGWWRAWLRKEGETHFPMCVQVKAGEGYFYIQIGNQSWNVDTLPSYWWFAGQVPFPSE